MDQEKNRRDDLEEPLYFDEEDGLRAEDANAVTGTNDAQEEPIEYLHRLINEMIDYVKDAKKGLFTQNVQIDRDVMIDNLHRIWELLPPAVGEAERVLIDRDRIIQEADEHARNVIRDADNRAAQRTGDAETIANRTVKEANEYYAQHKDDGDAYLAQRKQEGDAYLRDRQAEGDQYVSQVAHNADAQAKSIIESAERQRAQMIAQEGVVIAAEAEAQALRNQANDDYNTRVLKAEDDANQLYGAAYAHTQKLLRELGEFQKNQNHALRTYCEELEKRHEQPVGRQG